MFDIGFSKLLLVFIVGLIVLGPKRLPIAIKTIIGWVTALRAMANNVQQELNQELKIQELKESIKKAEQLGTSAISSQELNSTVDEIKQTIAKLQAELDSHNSILNRDKTSDNKEIHASDHIEIAPNSNHATEHDYFADEQAELAEQHNEVEFHAEYFEEKPLKEKQIEEPLIKQQTEKEQVKEKTNNN